jgi:hypothetical protein
MTSEPTLRRLVRVAEALKKFLGTIVTPEQRSNPHPVLRELFNRVDADTQALQIEADEQLRRAQDQLGLSADPQTAEGSL